MCNFEDSSRWAVGRLACSPREKRAVSQGLDELVDPHRHPGRGVLGGVRHLRRRPVARKAVPISRLLPSRKHPDSQVVLHNTSAR